MIVNQTSSENQEQNQYPSMSFKNFRRVLLACLVAGLFIGLVQFIMATILSSPTQNRIGVGMYWILCILCGLDAIALSTVIILYYIASICVHDRSSTYEYIYRSIQDLAIILILQIVNVGCYTYIWISDDGSTQSTVTFVLSCVKFAIFVVTFILAVIEYRKLQRINNTIRDSNFEPTIVATNINVRGQVAIVGRRPQNLAQLSVVSEMTNPSYDDLPPKYEDLDQPPTYEEALFQLQNQE